MTVNWSSRHRAETALTPLLKMGWEVSVLASCASWCADGFRLLLKLLALSAESVEKMWYLEMGNTKR